MGVVNKRPTSASRNTREEKKNTVTEVKENRLFSHFKISADIPKDGDYFGEIKEFYESKDKNYVRIAPYTLVSGKKNYYEDVFINLEEINRGASAAGQFLALFREARHIDDIKDRVIGVHIKLNEGKDGRIFKNVTEVFKTDEDDLVFDDKHIKVTRLNARDVTGRMSSDDEEDDDEEEEMTPKGGRTKKTQFADEIFDEDDFEDDDDDEEDDE